MEWEILLTGKLLIEFSDEPPILLENAFVNKVVLILSNNGKNNLPFILFDRIGIPDSNIIEYLENLEKTIVIIHDKIDDDGFSISTVVLIITLILLLAIAYLFDQ